MLSNFTTLQTKDPELNRVQDNISRVLAPLTKNGITDGIILSNVALVSGNNVVSHGLGRALVGWFAIRLRAAASIYDTQDSNLTPKLTLNLFSNATVTVDLYVF